MKDLLNEQRLFDNADNLARLARDRRIAAINASPRMAFVARLRDDQGHLRDLPFDTAPDFAQIERAARQHGICGQVHIVEIVARVVKPRPLLLTPWMRKRHLLAAE